MSLLSNSGLKYGPMNISQSLFNTDEKVAKESGLTNAFINQAKISTYYQDNPYGTLSYSDKFSVPTLGGPITSQGSGHRPGNVFKGQQVYEYQASTKEPTIQTSKIEGLIVPSNMARFT